eukprot:CAMPEP_0198282042 /NCGR_PEP_ID=MMETSP1449-20131203/1906_1 /TAXON_ID=420275 /ORGANISM="Attheya septentrionalis, Strain CCMP2084" /LENGTH=408 /DNA_ID=CAMNT_0043978113 /DNA_START=150 /DNA_END=1376 /DNA_ORIENTATION=-
MKLSWVIVVVASVVCGFVEGARFTGNPFFGKDFFLELGPLENGFGTEGRDVLLTALQEFQQTFEDGWKTSINAQGNNANFVSLEFNEWFVPEMLNGDFPVPNQFPSETGDTFLQFMAYRITSIEIDGIDNFNQLDQDTYLQAAFADNSFLPFLQAADATTTIFESVTTVTVRAFEDFRPTTIFDVGSIFNIPLYLELAPKEEGFGNETAEALIKDLDQFFIYTVGPVIAAGVEAEKPGSKIYRFGSLYTTADYVTYGKYYEGGNMVNQYTTLGDCSKGPTVVTEFLYGFDVWWWKPIDQGENRADIGNFQAWVNGAFANSAFVVGPVTTALLGNTPISYTGALDEFDLAKLNGTSTDAPLVCNTQTARNPTPSESPSQTSDASNTLVPNNLLSFVMTSAILVAAMSLI